MTTTSLARLSAALLVGTALAGAPLAAANASPEGFADVIKKVAPAVVTVSSTHHMMRDDQARMQGPEQFQIPEGSPFGEMFRRFFEEHGQGRPRQGPSEGTALGSGFIVDAQGYVVTNNHVIDGADDVKVTLSDGTELPATIVGRDPVTDLALLKIDSDRDLPYVQWGDSDAVEVGDWVVAVGNPFGLGGSVTAGIVSARGRDIGSGPLDDFLQIDAPINRGNSGGPAFDGEGKVVGVNTAILSPSGGSVGIGFAIPSDLAQQVVADLMDDGRVERGWIGVRIQEMSKELAEGMGLDAPKGALVADVTPGSPAANAGVQAGDVILAFGGQEIEHMGDLPRAVAGTKPGSEARLTVWRGGKERTLDVKIEPRPDEDQLAMTDGGSGGPANTLESDRLGLALAELNPASRQAFQVPNGVEGVVVADVAPDGPAAERGLRPGDVIVQVAQEKVSDPAEVAKLVDEAAEAGSKSVSLLVNRQGDVSFVAVPLAKA